MVANHWSNDAMVTIHRSGLDLEETPVQGGKVPTSIRALLHTLLPSYGRKNNEEEEEEEEG